MTAGGHLWAVTLGGHTFYTIVVYFDQQMHAQSLEHYQKSLLFPLKTDRVWLTAVSTDHVTNYGHLNGGISNAYK